MKKTMATLLISALIGALLLMSLGCEGGFMTQPSPTPKNLPGQTPLYTNGPNNTGGGVIEGFVEGETVVESEVPHVVAAIQAQREDAVIESITYVTYMGEQTYHVVVTQEGDDTTTEYYVRADGSIVSGDPNATGMPGTSPKPDGK